MTNETFLSIFGKTNVGGADYVNLMGGKGAHLAELHKMDLPVPEFVNLTTEAYREFEASPDPWSYVDGIAHAVANQFNNSGIQIGKDVLVSVRSGAPVSMPGMMDTILNVGLSLDNQEIWEERFGARWFWDCYSRLLVQLGETAGIKDLPKHDGAQGFRVAKKAVKAFRASNFDATEMTTPIVALTQAIHSVFSSWNTDRAIAYRQIHNIPNDLGTACNVQRMVFGNLNQTSGTGVMFTRDPATGLNRVTGEFLIQAQGEDVVDGSTTPLPLKEMKDTELGADMAKQLLKVAEKLEDYYHDVQDVEFTIENGKLWVLQTRSAKRTSEAAFCIAVEMIEEGDEKHPALITIEDALARITPEDWYSARGRKVLNAPKPNFTGLAAGTGVAVGRAVFTSAAAVAGTDPVILVRPETTPDDIMGMYSAEGIVTFEGGMTSHAAVVARGMNTPCIVGISGMAGQVNEGDIITMDSTTGRVWINAEVEISDRTGSDYADRLMMMAQYATKRIARRTRYAPYTVLPIAQMSDKAFSDMVTQVEEAGAWYDGVVLDTKFTLPFNNTDVCGLGSLATYSIPHTVTPMMKARMLEIARLENLGLKTYFSDEIPAVDCPAKLAVMKDQIVRIDMEAWHNFMGPVLDLVLEKLEASSQTGFIMDFIVTEDELVEVLFGE